ncbi:MAG TPA: hypothetical protein VLL77_11715, partial [Anaerolineales bacterium]|nr:hypothetical protein [Anaerolineales bacterium]
RRGGQSSSISNQLSAASRQLSAIGPQFPYQPGKHSLDFFNSARKLAMIRGRKVPQILGDKKVVFGLTRRTHGYLKEA